MVTALCTNAQYSLSQEQRHARACWLHYSESFFTLVFSGLGERPVVILVAQRERSSEGVVGCHFGGFARDDRHVLVPMLGEKEVALRQHSEAREQIFSFDRCDLFRHASRIDPLGFGGQATLSVK